MSNNCCADNHRIYLFACSCVLCQLSAPWLRGSDRKNLDQQLQQTAMYVPCSDDISSLLLNCPLSLSICLSFNRRLRRPQCCIFLHCVSSTVDHAPLFLHTSMWKLSLHTSMWKLSLHTSVWKLSLHTSMWKLSLHTSVWKLSLHTSVWKLSLHTSVWNLNLKVF